MLTKLAPPQRRVLIVAHKEADLTADLQSHCLLSQNASHEDY